MTAAIFGLLVLPGCEFLDEDTTEPEVNQTFNQEEDEEENQDEEERAEMSYLLRPDRSDITASHIAWEPVEGAQEYRLVISEESDDGAREVFAETTGAMHAQIPEDYRDRPDVTVHIEAMNAQGDIIGAGDVIQKAAGPLESDLFCYASCEAPQYSYTLRVWGDAGTGNNAQIQIGKGPGYAAFTYAQYLDQLAVSPTLGGRHHWCEDVGSEVAGEIVYNSQCNGMTGTVCFIEKGAGPWQDAVDVVLATDAVGWNAHDKCGVSLQDLALPFTTNTGILPALSCASPCYGDDGGDGGQPGGGLTGDWPWGTMDDMFLGREIPWGVITPGTGGDDGHGTGPGSFDDIPVADFLHHLADALADDLEADLHAEVGDDRYFHQAITLNLVGHGEDHIYLNLDHLRQYGADALPEVLSQLQEGELYTVVRYFGGHGIYGKAMVHRQAE